MLDTSEKDFESTVYAHLGSHSYTCRDSGKYDPAWRLDTEALFDFIYATQPATWQKLKVQHGLQVKERFLKRLAGEIEKRADFRKHVGDYVRLYAFLSQVITFTDAGLEKFYQFTRHLLRKLKPPDDPLPLEITRNINMDSYRIQETSSGAIRLIDQDGELKPISALGTGQPQEQELAPLSEIIQYINEHYGTNFTDADKVQYFADDMGRRLESQEGLRRAMDRAINPSEETRKLAFDSFFGDTLEDMIDANFEIYKKIKDDPNFGDLFRAVTYRRIAAAISAAQV